MPEASCEGKSEENAKELPQEGERLRGDCLQSENLRIAEAIAICKSALGQGGAQSGAELEVGAEWNQQLAALTSWATEAALWVHHLVPPELKDAGTREHYLFHRDEEPDRIFKITKGPGFGVFPNVRKGISRKGPVRYWFVDRAASPLEYLQRLWLLNARMLVHLDRQVYPVLTRLEGFAMQNENLRIVTSQPIFEGIPATQNEIAKWLIKQGFDFIKAFTWFRQDDGLAVFDTWHENVMATNGQIVPFDVIPIQAEGPLLESLKLAAVKVKMR